MYLSDDSMGAAAAQLEAHRLAMPIFVIALKRFEDQNRFLGQATNEVERDAAQILGRQLIS